MEFTIRQLIENKDYEGLGRLIRENPPLANQGIQNPFDNRSTRKAHPLHRIADAIFSAQLTEEEGIRVAKIFLDNGASINGEEQKDTPLIAAASLHADKLGIFPDFRGDLHLKN